ncbi:N-acetylmuramoyl-L-alanine amidase [Candidatus Peregrinibacteria bacterium]|nr:N-acetylmuramoyl-L-alanine amidase [Candidatus Peregrinibacteria bacterium]
MWPIEMIHSKITKRIVALALVAFFLSIPQFPAGSFINIFQGTQAKKTMTESWKEPLNITAEDRPNAESEFISQIKTTRFPIDMLEVQWDANLPEGTEMRLYMQFVEKGEWTPWQRVHADIDAKEGGESALLSFRTGRSPQATLPDTESILQEIPYQVPPSDGLSDESLHEHIQSQTAIVIANQAEKLRYKIILKTDDAEKKPIVKSLAFTNIFSPRLPSDSAPKNAYIPKNARIALAQPLDDEIFDPKEVNFDEIIAGLNVITENSSKIISRAEWGADESLRILDETPEESTGNNGLSNGETTADKTAMEQEFYENFASELTLDTIIETDAQGKKLKWPIEIAKNIKKFIIHHTATTTNLDNPKAAIRSIYYYHAIKRRWGDIGYNYIIDTEGNIYEGRAGGEKVVGGHASKHNTGSIGIAVLGNYSENEVPYAVLQSLINLIGEKALLYTIKPDGSGMFRGKNLPNILGHRDVGDTDCPGAKLYAAIPSLRKVIAAGTGLLTENARAIGSDGFDFEEAGTRSMVILKPNSTQKILFSLKNTGTETWNSSTFLVANDNPSARGMMDFKKDPQKETSIAPMKESSVAPGQTGTFEVTVQSLLKGGIATFDITPILNGKKKLQKYLALPVYVSPPKLAYAIYEMPTPPKTALKRGEKVTTWVKLQNTGDVPWKNDGETPVRLGTVNPRERKSPMKNGENRIGFLQQKEVKPGEIGYFTLEFIAPNTGGTYVEEFAPVMDGVGWMKEDKNLKFVFTVEGATYKGELISMSANTVFKPGEKKSVWIVLKNTGDVVWKKGGEKAIKVGVVKPKGSIVTGILMEQASVAPLETGKWNFSIKAPEKEGKYQVYLRPRVSGKLLIKKPIIVRFQVSKETTSQKNLIRVAIGFSGNPVIAADGLFTMEVGGSETTSFAIGEKAEVSFENRKYSVKKGEEITTLEKYPRFVPSEGTILRIDNFTNRPSWSPNANDNQYRGIFEVRDVDGALTVINELPLEDYLKGVAEPAESDPFEKIKTLAILARTYAKYYLIVDRKFPDKPYDASDDPGIFQRYLGYGYELRADNMRRAVSETEGLVVTYQGKIVKTPYFHSSDGRTRSGEEVFGWTNTLYLQSVSDPYCEGQVLSGHGVGLSGCGSYGMAKAGKTYEEIIKYYFQGVEIEKVE